MKKDLQAFIPIWGMIYVAALQSADECKQWAYTPRFWLSSAAQAIYAAIIYFTIK